LEILKNKYYEILLEIGFNIRRRYYSADVARRCGRGIMLGREYISLRIILYLHVYSTIIQCCNGFYILSIVYLYTMHLADTKSTAAAAAAAAVSQECGR